MQGLYAIYRKELSHFFVSPVAYAIVGFYAFICAAVFNFSLGQAVQQAAQMEMQGGGAPVDLPGIVLQGYFMFIATLLLFVVPMITMSTFAEERKRGTIELLMTSPVTETQIVLGKFFGSLTFLAAMLLATVVPIIFMYFCSDPHFRITIVLVDYLGAVLIGGALMAVGTFISSLTENQIIAAVVTFVLFLMLWLVEVFTPSGTSSPAAAVFQYLSIIKPFQDFVRGVIDTTSLVYYFSLIVFFVFLTVRSVDSMRWRRA